MPKSLFWRKLLKATISVVLGVSLLPSWAGESIEISNIKMPEIPPVSRTGALYFTLTNNTDKTIVLKDVSAEVAHHTMIHLSQEIDGIAKMKHLDEISIAPHSQLEFSPGGYHIMFMGLKHGLLDKPFNVELQFNHQITKNFVVEVGQRKNNEKILEKNSTRH